MAPAPTAPAASPAAQPADLLRFVACGSVDDGKSTLIGALLHVTRAIPDDEFQRLRADSETMGTRGAQPDLALLLDGLAAEREQGITIDVAYRHFATTTRRFVVADAPGHLQYTRNMVTAASTAEAALILVDARKGLLPQTLRHAWVLALMGVRQVALVVNKMDLVGFEQAVFLDITRAWQAVAQRHGFDAGQPIAVVAADGDNVAHPSDRMPWYQGPTVLTRIESFKLDSQRLQAAPLRLPVQWVSRPDADFRGYCGLIASGTLRPGERVRVLPSGQTSRVERLVSTAGDLAVAVAGQSVTLTLADAIDIARGDLIASASEPPEVADQFECTLVWLANAPMLPGRSYGLKIATRTVVASVTELKHRIDVESGAALAAKRLDVNEIGVANIALDGVVAFDPYQRNRDTGGFILIDRQTNDTVAAGLLHFALRRAQNIQPQALKLSRNARSAAMGQRPMVLWFTGLSGAGKSTLANAVEALLHAAGLRTALLDGDNLRQGLNRDLGFSAADRVENVRRTAEVARLMADAGLIVLVALISPFRAERSLARSLLPEGEFLEIFVDASLALAEARDTKGLYARARRGELDNFTGIDSPYEAPESPDLRIDTEALSVEAGAERVVRRVLEVGG